MEQDYFYDIHCHLMDMSHPNLIAFLRRLNLRAYLAAGGLPVIGSIATAFVGTRLSSVVNLLSVMDRGIAGMIQALNDDIQLAFRGPVRVGVREYRGVILTPLMIDFGVKDVADMGALPDIHYRRIPHKAIAGQVIDLFNGIRESYAGHPREIVGIYPFLGINPANYHLETGGGHTGIRDLLNKYFSSCSRDEGEARAGRIEHAARGFSGSIEDLGDHAFAGVKVYPPLGFDPWPRSDEEREKVVYLYRFCEEKNIPITTHCGGRGYRAIPASDAELFTSPMRWEQVLDSFPRLKVNFAHFGGGIGGLMIGKWTRQIAELILHSRNRNVYTDLAYLCFGPKDYRGLLRTMEKLSGGNIERLCDRILFGTDFMIHLMDCDSYASYLQGFIQADFLDQGVRDLRHRFCCENPRRFLFYKPA